MKIRTLLAISVAIFSTTSYLNAAPKIAEPLEAPTEVSCTIQMPESTTQQFDINWNAVEGASKYSAELLCANDYGSFTTSASVKADDCDEGCTVSLSNEEVREAVQEAIDSGEMVVPDDFNIDEVSLGYCGAKVKGLNPPGKRQNHEFSEMVSCGVVQEISCPAWSAEELALVGSYGAPNRVEDGGSTWDGFIDSIMDYEWHDINELEDGEVGVNIYAQAYQLTSGEYYGVFFHYYNLTAVEGKEIIRDINRTQLTVEEYEACIQEIRDHKM